MNIQDFQKKKLAQEKISMVTCYDYTMSCIVNKTNIDCVLVGDSLAMVIHGYPNTTMATMPMMALHTQAVARGLTNKFLIADLPFLSYRKSVKCSMTAVEQLIQAGAQAVKLEGVAGNIETIQHIVESGVPVMGHIGLTPQAVNQLGGHKVQGKDRYAQLRLIEEAQRLEQVGCFAIVLEGIPAILAKAITEKIAIPTIGIGAGPDTDGQVLVLQDLLGLQTAFKPKFVKHYLTGFELMKQAINNYIDEINASKFPMREVHTYAGELIE